MNLLQESVESKHRTPEKKSWMDNNTKDQSVADKNKIKTERWTCLTAQAFDQTTFDDDLAAYHTTHSVNVIRTPP